MTNYIHRLQNENEAKARQVEELEAGIADLVSYLTSPKFNDDTTVQVSDVLLRLSEIKSAAQYAHDETEHQGREAI